MPSNKIGIEVQVEFQTVGELQAELAKKWASVKKNFTAKVNVDVDERSLASMRAKIKKALSDNAVEIKLSADMSEAFKAVNKFQTELRKLDHELSKNRELKIKVAGLDMDKAFKDVLQDMKNIDKLQDASAKKTQQAYRDQGKLIDTNMEKVAKLQRISKQMADGSYANTIKSTYNDGADVSRTVTQKPNGMIDISETFNQEKALREIEDTLKRIHQLEMSMKTADKESTALMNKELGIHKQQLSMLQEEYQLKYKANSMDEGSTQALVRSQQLVASLKDQAMYAKEVSNEEKEIANAVSRVAQLEAKKSQLAVQMVNAKGNELNALREEYGYHDKIQAKISESNNLTQKMTASQREELDAIRTSAMLQVEKAQAKKADAEATQRLSQAEREYASQMKRDLKEIQSLQLKIHEIQSRGSSKEGDYTNLQNLQKALAIAKQIQNENRTNAESQGLVSNKLREQLGYMEKLHQGEMQRVQAVAQNNAKQDAFNSKMKAYEDSLRRINQLQRDLQFSGVRESGVIERALGAEREKASVLEREIMSSKQLTSSRREEISAIKQAQSEELRLSRLRQDAKDKDRAFNTTGGAIDPYSTYAGFEQGFREILKNSLLIDEAFVKVNKVADASDKTMQRFKDTSYDTGSQLGVTADQYMLAVEKWVTAGKNFTESQDLAKTSLVGSFVGNIKPDDMVKWMSVPMEAFQKQGLKSNDVINVMNETANQNAIEMEELGKAYMRSAGTAKDAGVSFEDLTGMITGAQEATRMGGERIGTAIKTMSLNFGNMRAQMTAGEKRKFNFFKDSLGIDLSEAESMTDVIGQLAGKWKDMSVEEKSTAKFYLAGKEHANVLQGIIDQWETVGQASKTAQDQMGKGVDGSAYKEFEKQQDSVRFRLAKLQNAWLEFTNKIGENGGLLAKTMEVLTNGLQIATDLMNNPAFMNVAKWLAIAVAIKAITNAGKRMTDVLTSGFRDYVARVTGAVNALKNLKKGTDDVNSSSRRLIDTNREIARASQESARIQQASARETARVQQSGASAMIKAGKIQAGSQAKAPAVLKAPSTPEVRTVVYKANTEAVKKAQAEVTAGNKPVIRSVVWKADTRMVKKAQAEVAGTGSKPVTRTLVYKADASQVKKAQGEVARTNQAVAQSASATVTKTGLVKGAIKGLAGMIPIVGDALIMMEMMGIPVFETIGKGFKGLVNSADEARKAFEKTASEFEKSNAIINGSLDKNKAKLADWQNQLNSAKSSDMGQMGHEDFAKFKSDFNDTAKDLGLKVRIEMNDTSQIQSALDALKNKLNGVKEQSTQKIAIQVGDSLAQIDKLKSSLQDLEAQKEKLKNKADMLKGLIDAGKDNPAIKMSQDYRNWEAQLESTKNKLSEVNGKIKEQKGDLADTKASMDGYVQSALAQGSAFDSGNLKMSERKTLLDQMRQGQETLNDAVANGNLAGKQFAEAGTLTATNWGLVQQLVPQVASAFGDWSAQEINGSKQAQTAVKGLINDYVKKGTVSAEAGQKAIQALEKEIASDEKAKNKKNEKGKAGKKAGDDSASGSNKAKAGSDKEASADEKAKNKKSEKGKAGKKAGEDSASGSNKAKQGADKEASAHQKAGQKAQEKGAKGKKAGADSASGSNQAKSSADKEASAHQKAGQKAQEAGQKGKKAGADSASGSQKSASASKQAASAHDKTAQSASKAGKAGQKAGNDTASGMNKGKAGADNAKRGLDGASSSAKKLGKDASDAGNKVKAIPSHKESKFTFKVFGIDLMDKVKSFFSGSYSKSGSISITKTEKTVKKDKSVSSRSVSSNSVSSAGGIPVRGISSLATSANGAVKDNATSTTPTTPPAKVSEDVWRYWNKEDAVSNLDDAIKDLTRTLQWVGDDQSAQKKLYEQMIPLLRQQMTAYRNLQGAKDSEMNSTLNSLKKYGFNVNTSTNTISNLDHAKSLSGTKAEEAEKLLNTYHSLSSELITIGNNMSDITTQIFDTQDKIKKNNIAIELEKYDAVIKRIDALLTKVNNSDSIFAKRLEFLGSNDSELALITNEQAMASAKSNMASLISQFNSLSKASIGYEENGTALKASLDKLSTEILAQADAIVKYEQAINDLEISRVTNDLTEFGTAVDSNVNKLKNNVTNLKDGLLSGTDFGDLASSKSTGLELGRNNIYEAVQQERINLEVEMQQALDAFAKKNIDRVKGVSNAELDITATKYNSMLKMQKDYTAGQTASYSQIVKTFDELAGVGKLDNSYTFITKLDNAFDALQAKQDKMKTQYEKDLASAKSQEAKDAVTNKFIINNMKLQEEYLQKSIQANNDAIAEYKNQLKDSTLTDDQFNKINTQIDTLEKENLDSQNAIKASVKERFDFEFSLLTEAMSKYDQYATDLTYAQNLISAIGGDNFKAKGLVMDQMLDVEKARNKQLDATLDSLNKQMSSYEKGSYEWNMINAQVTEYNKLLQASNLQLIEMNKNILKNSFDNTMNKVQKEMFDGKTIEDFKSYHDLWVTGLERELALEKMYGRIADLGTKNFDEKMALLDKQEKMSRYEMDYMNKQLDLIELQQKLENLSNERTVQTLKQNADGTWDWQYTANQGEIDKAQEELNNKQLEMETAQQQAREDYSTKLEAILTKAENGQYDSAEGFQSAISDLTEAYDSIVGDFPKIKDEYIKSLIDSYSEYIKENGDVVNGNIPSTATPIYEGFSTELVKAFNDISKDIGETFANALISKLPNFGKATESSTTSKSVSINLDKVEFPNATDKDSIQEAILSLPQIALQKSKEKL
ncbi:phage tail tape measure protein [Priestia aryabhattai]|uniref:phage tail tape measure protein n=1 Tax=Priestia megaterium TaxID=1404 RepID=UPI003F9ADA06